MKVERDPNRSQVRSGRRFRPSEGVGTFALETRELLSHMGRAR